jgi:hypothetical protein
MARRRSYRALAKDQELTVRTSKLWACDLDGTDATLGRTVQALESGSVERRLADAWLRTVGLKAILSADPRGVDPAAILKIQVDATMVDGRVVFDREPVAQ